jgi:membrane protease YdiL (CAAX protease family)
VTAGRRRYLTAELLVLFVLAPASLYLFRYLNGRMPFVLLPTLWVGSIVCLVVMRVNGRFRFANLLRVTGWRRDLPRVLGQWIVLATVIAGLTLWLEPGRLFGLVRQRPRLWIMIMCLYPIFSALPQTIIWRAFLFNRYEPLVGDGRRLILLSAVTFSFSHLLFQNWFALGFTLVGGLMFAWTYARTRSVIISTIEHALYGDFLFTIGLGWYFYHGAS